jgi:glycosyltransferase involved in cell wall biosynthesis
LCNLDIAFAELLLKNNISATVLRSKVDPSIKLKTLASYPKYFDLDHFLYAASPYDFLKALHKSDILISITGAVIGKYGMLWPLAGVLLSKPVISVATGSDIAELAIQDNVAARVYRKILRRSVRILTPPFTGIIKNLKLLNLLGHTSYIRYPVFFAGDLNSQREIGSTQTKLRVLHVANLDWGVVDNGPWRKWTKRSDIFLKGILEAMALSENIECKIAYRGPDRDLAKKMILESGFADRFEWFNEVDQHDLQKIIASGDLMADQFDAGALGLTAIEAMGLGTPVLTYLDDQFLQNSYSLEDFPPVVNLRDSSEIAEFLITANRKDLWERGGESREWAIRNHDLYKADFSNILRHLA